jgi:hypothetical protein
MAEVTIASANPAPPQPPTTSSNNPSRTSSPEPPSLSNSRSTSPLPAGVYAEVYRTYREAWDECRTSVATTTAILNTAVSEPQQCGSFLQKYVTYLVRTEPYTYLVRRRYSDFLWLRQVLERRYIGMLLPCLPPKNYTGGVPVPGKSSSSSTSDRMSVDGSSSNLNKGAESSSHVQHRMRMLSIFLEKIVNIPYVRGDSSVLAFLSIQNEKEWEEAQKQTALEDLFTSKSTGCQMWRKTLASAVIPENGQRILLDFISQLDYLSGHISKMLSITKNIVQRSNERKNETVAFSNAFAEWGRTEQLFGDHQKFEYVNKDSGQMVKLLGSTDSMLNALGKVQSFGPVITESVLSASLTYLLLQVEGFQALIKSRDIEIRELQKAQTALTAKKQMKENGGGDQPKKSGMFNFTAKSETVNDAIIREEEEVKNRSNRVDSMARALFFCEIDRFNEERRIVVQAAFGMMAASELMVTTREAKIYNTFFSKCELDVGEESQKAKDLLNLQEESVGEMGNQRN